MLDCKGGWGGGLAYSQEAVSGLQSPVLLSGPTLDDLGDVDAVVSGDVLVADAPGDAEPQSCAWGGSETGVTSGYTKLRLNVGASNSMSEQELLCICVNVHIY